MSLNRKSKFSVRHFPSFLILNSSFAISPGDIRQKLIEADLVDCMVALLGQLFYSTQMPVCLVEKSGVAQNYTNN